MPSKEGTRLEPGRDSESERKRAEGAWSEGVIEKRLDAHAAPSAALFVTGGMVSAMTELRGRAIPRIPSKLEDSGSLLTESAAAANENENAEHYKKL